MTRIFVTFMMIVVALIMNATNDFIESFDLVSDDYSDEVYNVSENRPINGGTVIIPVFDESCSEEMKAPFSYACKIVEEFMPPCLPIRVKVSCGDVDFYSGSSISLVKVRNKVNFGMTECRNVPMSVIKGVVLEEMMHFSTVTYLDSIPNVEFFTEENDIEITYYTQKLKECSFSLDTVPGNKYDFVSIVVRDLLKGLGLSSSFSVDAPNQVLIDPMNFTPFERCISARLGNFEDPAARLTNATNGELLIKDSGYNVLKLYAPSPWQDGYSLNYFIRQQESDISKVLSYDFCKGLVTRSLSNDDKRFVFKDLLGWKADYLLSMDDPKSTSVGNASLKMNYNGSITFDDKVKGYRTEVEHSGQNQSPEQGYYEREELYQYLRSFHPFLYDGDNYQNEGVSVSVLKKDGSWDLVKFNNSDDGNPTLHMSDLQFNCSPDEYARTLEGFLRARITKKKHNNLGTIEYNTIFFVIEYLPQTPKLSYEFIYPEEGDKTSKDPNDIDKTVRIYFSDTEGIIKMNFIKHSNSTGKAISNPIDSSEIKKGYFETKINRTTTFTIQGENENGSFNDLTLKVSLIFDDPDWNIKFEGSCISIVAADGIERDYQFEICPVEYNLHHIELSGLTTRSINIASLSSGIYVLRLVEVKTGMSKTFKFTK